MGRQYSRIDGFIEQIRCSHFVIWMNNSFNLNEWEGKHVYLGTKWEGKQWEGLNKWEGKQFEQEWKNGPINENFVFEFL